jgi:hypothetical protein
VGIEQDGWGAARIWYHFYASNGTTLQGAWEAETWDAAG